MNREYFAQVEAAFQRLAGGLVLGPLDARIIAAWESAGVPLDVVYEGISAAFERDRKRPIRHLAHVKADVERALKRWQARRVGQRPAHLDESLGTVFERLRDQFQARASDPDPLVRQLAREAAAGLNGMASLARDAALPDPVEMLDSLAAQLGQSALRHAQGKLATELSALSNPDRVWREVRTRLQLPPLVVDLGGGW